jgi:Ca2+:H+ antiporter
MTGPEGSSVIGRVGSRAESSSRGASDMFDVEDASITQPLTFRSVAIARRFMNNSRRNSLRQLSVRSDLTVDGDGDLYLDTEQTPLQPTISEDKESYHGSLNAPTATTTNTEESIWTNFLDIWIGKPISLLLFFAPFACASHYLEWGPQWIFWLNFLTMVPLASILGDFTEEAALHTNDVVGGLLNASFGNAVEVVVAIQALMKDEIRVVQSSMIGSIFSNLLLVLGMCFFFGGIYHKEQSFSGLNAMSGMGLLALSSIAMILPTPFAAYWEVEDESVLIISRVSAIFLLLSYLQLLYFQLYTHKDSFEAEALENTEKRKSGKNGDGDDHEEEATIPMWLALLGLTLTTGSVTIFSNFLVESIDGFCVESGISRTFVGLIILPIVGNAVEHITAVSVAMKNKMDLVSGEDSEVTAELTIH